MIKNIIKEALSEFFSSDEGRALVVKAVKTAMIYDIELEKKRPDDTFERIKKRGDILAFIASWIKRSEGAIRGCQQDVEKVHTKAFEIRNAIGYMLENNENNIRRISEK